MNKKQSKPTVREYSQSRNRNKITPTINVFGNTVETIADENVYEDDAGN